MTQHRGRSLTAPRAVLLTVAAGLLASVGVVTPVAAQPTSVTGPAPAATAKPLPYQNPRLSTEARVADLLARMTLEEKVGQMTQTERFQVYDDPSLIATHHLGSILSGGGSTPAQNTPQAWADMVDEFQRAALDTRLGIPLIYGIDAVHGNGNVLGATVFPHNIGLGASRDPGLVRDVAHVTAEETRATGPQWNFSPCICVALDDRWGRTYESFGETADLAIRMATAIDGYQGRPGHLDDPDRVLATAKHFAGDGATEFGTGEGDYTIDQGIDVTSRREFRQVALRQYRPAVTRHDVGSVMPSFSSIDWTEDGVGNPIKMHANGELVTGVLKQQMGFEGFVISDWKGIHQIPDASVPADAPRPTPLQVRTAVNAGVDMSMEPDDYLRFQDVLTTEVEAGRVSTSRIDDAVSRILTAKFELGLFEQPFTDRRHIDEVGGPAHRALAREAVQKSQVLLSNEGRTLPLSGDEPAVYVAGSNADNIGNQAGGWTISWQGGSTHQIPGSTVLDGIEEHADGVVTFSADASAPVPSDATGIVVVGETPYSEGFGDVGGPRWAFDPGDDGQPRPVKDMKLSAADQQAVETVCSQAAECVVVVISGRPLEIAPEQLATIDALVAAWLPGSEGAGVADTLFGAAPYQGRLPVTWPRTVAQQPINVGDADYDPLYPFGHGLRTRVR